MERFQIQLNQLQLISENFYNIEDRMTETEERIIEETRGKDAVKNLKELRRKWFRIPYRFLMDILQYMDGKTVIHFKGMPKDAVIIRFSEHMCFSTNEIAVQVWSSEFPILPEGALIPEIEPDISINTIEEVSRSLKDRQKHWWE